MKTEKWLVLPVCCAVLLCLYPIPYFAIQALPDSITQKGRIVEYVLDAKGRKLEIVLSNGKPRGLFRGTGPSVAPLWSVSLFAKKWYFSPIARVLHRTGGGSEFKYL